MKRAKKKFINVRNSKPCGEQSPYWNWLETRAQSQDNEFQEPAEANPDVLPEGANVYLSRISEAEHEKVQAILAGLSILTPRERQVVELCAQGMSLDQVATILRLSKNTVWGKLNRARKKIVAFMGHDEVE